LAEPTFLIQSTYLFKNEIIHLPAAKTFVAVFHGVFINWNNAFHDLRLKQIWHQQLNPLILIQSYKQTLYILIDVAKSYQYYCKTCWYL